MPLTSAEIIHARLVHQQLVGTAFGLPDELVGWFGAMQAQEYALTKWSIGLRLPHLKDADIEEAFTSGRILRTHLLRPTWHFVTPDDIRWMLALTAPHVQAGNRHMYRRKELDGVLFARCNDVLVKVLSGGKSLSRAQINEHFKVKKVTADGIRLALIMMQAELEGIVCSGARKGNQFTYSLLEERVAPMPAMERDEALAALTVRYYTSRGPATIADFATWSGLSVKDIRAGIGMTKPQLSVVRMDGLDYYSAAGGGDAMKASPGAEVHLLPPYDEYIMGYKNRDALRPDWKGSLPAPRLLFDNMIVYEGRIAGSWRRMAQKNHIDLEYHFIKRTRSLKKAFGVAVSRFEAFTVMSAQPMER